MTNMMTFYPMSFFPGSHLVMKAIRAMVTDECDEVNILCKAVETQLKVAFCG